MCEFLCYIKTVIIIYLVDRTKSKPLRWSHHIFDNFCNCRAADKNSNKLYMQITFPPATFNSCGKYLPRYRINFYMMLTMNPNSLQVRTNRAPKESPKMSLTGKHDRTVTFRDSLIHLIAILQAEKSAAEIWHKKRDGNNALLHVRVSCVWNVSLWGAMRAWTCVSSHSPNLFYSSSSWLTHFKMCKICVLAHPLLNYKAFHVQIWHWHLKVFLWTLLGFYLYSATYLSTWVTL